MDWLVEQARPSDFPNVHAVVAAAFGREDEAQLVERLRVSDVWLPGFALVARPLGQPRGCVVGFSTVSRITVGGRPALALAPVAVAPEWQQKGAGSALVRTGSHERLVVASA